MDMKIFAVFAALLMLGVVEFAHAQDDGSIVAWGSNSAGQSDVPTPNEGFVAVAGGNYHSLGLKEDSSIMAWGWNDHGQCNVPAPNEDYVAVAGGNVHSLGLKADGSIVAWGSNTYGQCDVPAPNEDFVAVAGGGGTHGLGLKADGSIVAWGFNAYGQCDIPAPNEGFVAVAAGTYHSFGLKEDGSIVVWGRNNYGQCNVPAPNEDFVAVAGGCWYSLGLKEDGSIVAWGSNTYGQCDVPEPNEGFIAVSGGWYHSLGLKEDGSIVAWGRNYEGQCNVPAPNEGFVAVSGGGLHSLGLHAYLHVIEPDSSTIWAQLTTDHPVGWTGVYCDSVSITLYDGALFIDTLAASAPNTGSWVFCDTVPINWDPGTQYKICIEDDLGYLGWSEEFTVSPPVPIAGNESTGICGFALHNAAPNPSYGMALVAFEIPVIENVCITVYDVSGRAVTELAYIALAPGIHEAMISDLHAGFYIVHMQAGGFSDYGKMIVIR